MGHLIVDGRKFDLPADSVRTVDDWNVLMPAEYAEYFASIKGHTKIITWEITSIFGYVLKAEVQQIESAGVIDRQVSVRIRKAL